MFRNIWQNRIKFNWVFGVVLILLLGIPRFIIVLHANIIDNFHLIPIVFLIMWFLPLIFLTKEGRRHIGIVKPSNYYWLLYSFIAGVVICFTVYLIGVLLFKHTLSNWFVYMFKSYSIPGNFLTDSQRQVFFIIGAFTGITFSPIGEEFLYRGLIHESFVKKLGEQGASRADSLAFALTHLSHFGIVYISGTWSFLFIPAVIWVLLMFISSRIFFICKQKTGSILGAIISHAAFNLTMMYLIFYHLLP
jgi:membrane protease YdiL (CAAX protease family)